MRFNDQRARLWQGCLMEQPKRVQAGKTPQRLHFIAEWAEHRHLRQADVARELGVDKGLVSRWFAGQLPKTHNIAALAALLDIEPNMLFRHPDEDWLASFFRSRSNEDLERAKQVLDLAFPKRDGTDG